MKTCNRKKPVDQTIECSLSVLNVPDLSAWSVLLKWKAVPSMNRAGYEIRRWRGSPWWKHSFCYGCFLSQDIFTLTHSNFFQRFLLWLLTGKVADTVQGPTFADARVIAHGEVQANVRVWQWPLCMWSLLPLCGLWFQPFGGVCVSRNARMISLHLNTAFDFRFCIH